jgi:putative transposase
LEYVSQYVQRTNVFEVRPLDDEGEEMLRTILDASAALWNEVTYDRRQLFFSDESIWDATGHLDRYKHVLGYATAQQVLRKNEFAWKSFFTFLEDPSHEASPPGYWGNEADGRELRTVVRHDQYTLQWGERSRLEIPVGQQLKDEYGLEYHDRLRLEVVGEPRWDGDPGQLKIRYDEVTDTFRAHQPVTVDETELDSPLASEEAALDIGANNLVACTTTTGTQYLYSGRRLFERFLETTTEIAAYEKQADGRTPTTRMRRLYRRRSERRNHAQDALVRDLLERLYDEGVSRLYVGDLTSVLDAHWSATVNLKTHEFWAFRRFINRLDAVRSEFGIQLVETSEAWTTQECPDCGERENTTQRGDAFQCGACGFEGHADLKASRVFLERETGSVGPMARPVRFEWDDQQWRPLSSVTGGGRVMSVGDRIDRSIHEVGNVAPGETEAT